MRLNKFLALHTDLSRRGADLAIEQGRVQLDNRTASVGDTVSDKTVVVLDGKTILTNTKLRTIMFHKPAGYVCSRNGQGSSTIYNILPSEYHNLNPVGRLDKDSSGLLILTNDGKLAERLTHPKYMKIKIYDICLDKPLQPLHQQLISDYGVTLKDGVSRFEIQKIEEHSNYDYRVTMYEGRNRQIRRTFASLGYEVTKLHRTHFGPYAMNNLESGKIDMI